MTERLAGAKASKQAPRLCSVRGEFGTWQNNTSIRCRPIG